MFDWVRKKPRTPTTDIHGMERYVEFGSRRFAYRTGGQFVAAWVNDRQVPRYLNVVHAPGEGERIIERLGEISATLGGGVRKLDGRGATYQFYGRISPQAGYSSIRVDQQPLAACMSSYPRWAKAYGLHVTTFKVGRSAHGKMFGLYCAFGVLQWPMLIDVARVSTEFKFGRYNLFGKQLNVAELSRAFITEPAGSGVTEKFAAKIFKAPHTICLQAALAVEQNRFLEKETAAEIKRTVQLLVSSSCTGDDTIR